MSRRRVDAVLAGVDGVDGLRQFLRGGLARRDLRRHIGRLVADPWTLGPCRLRRAKLKPGRKLSAYYEVLLADEDAGGHARRAVAITWTPPAVDPIPALESLDGAALANETERRGVRAPFATLKAWPEDGMRILVSPLDERFPQLVRMSDPHHVASELLGESSQCRVSTVRYRPGQRHVLRYERGDDGASPVSPVFFAKLYSDERGAETFRRIGQLAEHLDDADADLSVWQPFTYLPADRALVSRAVVGTALSRHLRREGTDLPWLLWRAGRGLRALQSVPTTAVGDVAARELADEIAATVRASEHVAALAPALGVRIAAVLEQARDLYDVLPGEASRFAHGDFKADHLWVEADGLVAIDFDSSCLADPALDCGKFLADLRWSNSLFGSPDPEPAQARFLEGYLDGTNPRTRLARSHVFEALWLVKIAARRVPIFERDWSYRTEELISQAESVLATTVERFTRIRGRLQPGAAAAAAATPRGGDLSAAVPRS